MADTSTHSPGGESLEYRFRWNAAEHRRFYRAVQREVRRSSLLQRLLWAWLWLLLGFFALGMLAARSTESMMQGLRIVAPLAVVMIVMRWGLAYLSARAYAREHAACIPNDQIRLLTADGIAARCTTSSATVKWSGVTKVRETPDFFLFFTTPNCAIQLPKRAVDDVDALREWLKRRTTSAESAAA